MKDDFAAGLPTPQPRGRADVRRRAAPMRDYCGCSDGELVALALGGDDDAYGELAERWKNAVCADSRRILRDDAAAEDVAQETFLDCWLRLGSLREPDKIGAWLRAAARSKSLNRASRERRFDDLDGAAASAVSEADPVDAVIRRERTDEVKRAISSLPSALRETAELYYFGELSVSAIKERLGVPAGTVKRRLYDARSRLKGALAYMDETRRTPDDYGKMITEKIKELNKYYRINGTRDGISAAVEETVALIETLPDSKEKRALRADALICGYYGAGEPKDMRQRILEDAKAGGNASVMADLYVDELLAAGHDYAGWLEKIDNGMLPAIRRYCTDTDYAVAALTFWRSVALTHLGRIDEGREGFVAAEKLFPRDEAYRANAIAAVRGIDFAREYGESGFFGMEVMGETYEYIKDKLMFMNEPGFGVDDGANTGSVSPYSALMYYISRCSNIFFDTSMKPGDTCKSRDGTSTLTCVSVEDAAVAAGTFRGCMKLRYSCKPKYDADIYYADGVGLVKAVFTGNYGDAEYELCEYRINGGSGCFPFAAGNLWRYSCSVVPSYVAALHEWEIIWTDGVRATASVVDTCVLRKNFRSDAGLDGDFFLRMCGVRCNKNDYDGAIEELRSAVRLNRDDKSMRIAIKGIDYLTRFGEYAKKNYRLCPSTIDGSYLNISSDGAVRYDEGGYTGFGPYRFGTRFEENRIFGAKPMRYLQELAGAVWDRKWTPGYTQEICLSDGEVTGILTVSDGGEVAVPAGTFENTLLLTIDVRDVKLTGDYWFENDYSHVHCGAKRFWYARGVGIVRHVCEWGTQLSTDLRLASYDNPAGGDDYLPIYIGCRWEYDEANLTAEGYRAKRIAEVLCGRDGRYLLSDAQEFIYLGDEEAYEAFKASLKK